MVIESRLGSLTAVVKIRFEVNICYIKKILVVEELLLVVEGLSKDMVVSKWC
jgi:hypothetical protein